MKDSEIQARFAVLEEALTWLAAKTLDAEGQAKMKEHLTKHPNLRDEGHLAADALVRKLAEQKPS